jgi:hypothetical protein
MFDLGIDVSKKSCRSLLLNEEGNNFAIQEVGELIKTALSLMIMR